MEFTPNLSKNMIFRVKPPTHAAAAENSVLAAEYFQRVKSISTVCFANCENDDEIWENDTKA